VAASVSARNPAGVEVVEHEGEPIELIEVCEGAPAVWIVDAVSSGAPAGALHRFDAGERALPAALFGLSSHRLGLAAALELSRTLGRLPPRVIVYGIEGAQFETGQPLSPAVALAAERLAGLLFAELAADSGGS
jgi:hydrogenase maturation protease